MILKCKMCGGDIEPIEGTNTGKCLYCKSVMTLPSLEDEKIVNLYNRANKLRLDSEFDKAYEIYESILKLDQEQVEAHWGLVLCKYGIEYVDDPRTKKKVPTCHRANYESVLVNSDYRFVKEHSYGEALKLYEEEANYIQKIQKRILDISSKEEPYDIFICYKETDSEGERTKDSVLAQNIYQSLTKEGYKVFFSRITLEDKLGTEYEPYIFSALNSAKVMLVVGTSTENLESVWVKNEWSRYLSFMKEDSAKSLVPVYSQMDAYELPEEFSMLQAQNMDKVGAMQDLVHGIEKLMSSNNTSKKQPLDKKTTKQVQEVLEGVTSLGNNRYEVTIVKEKRATWYYLFIIALVFVFLLCSLLVIEENFSIAFSNGYHLITNVLFGNNGMVSISNILVILQSLISLLIVVVGFLKLRNRKLVHVSNYVMLGVFFLDFLLLEVALHYICIPSLLYWFTVFLSFLFLLVNPIWNLDTSTKTIVEGEEKDRLLLKNKTIRENFTRKDRFPFPKKFFLLGIGLCIVIYGITIFPMVFSHHGNDRDESKTQIEIISNFVAVRKSPFQDEYQTIGIAKKGEIYTVLSTSYEGSNECFKIKQSNSVKGYVCGSPSNFKLLNSQGNERNSSVKQLEVINDYIRIRKEPSLYSDMVGQVYQGEFYTILEDKKQSDGSSWYRIKTSYGVMGYIYSGENKEYVKIYDAE